MVNRVKSLRQFIQDDPSDPFNKYALALELIAKHEHKEALNWISELLSEHPDYVPTYYQAAHFYWDLGMIKQAGDTFDKGIRLALEQGEQKALVELRAAYQNFKLEEE